MLTTGKPCLGSYRNCLGAFAASWSACGVSRGMGGSPPPAASVLVIKVRDCRPQMQVANGSTPSSVPHFAATSEPTSGKPRTCAIKSLASVARPSHMCSHLKPATVLCGPALTVLCHSAPAVLCESALVVLCGPALAVLWESALVVLCVFAQADAGAGAAVVAAAGAWQCLLLAHCQAQQGAALLSAPAPSMTFKLRSAGVITKSGTGSAHDSIAGGSVKLACRLRRCCLVSLRIFTGSLDTHCLPSSFATAPRPLCSTFLMSKTGWQQHVDSLKICTHTGGVLPTDGSPHVHDGQGRAQAASDHA